MDIAPDTVRNLRSSGSVSPLSHSDEMTSSADSATSLLEPEQTTAPHRFKPLRPWDIRPEGRCRHCYLPSYIHPVRSWTAARQDMRAAEVTWETLADWSSSSATPRT
jgi:hypothetical protein